MNIAQKLTTIAQNEETVYFSGVYDAAYQAGHDTGYCEGVEQGKEQGKTEMNRNITGLYFFFYKNQNMNLLPQLLASDMSHITMAQYAFQDNTQLTEFHAPDTMRIGTPNYMFQRCTNLVRVSGLDKGLSTVVITGLFDGCTSLADAGTLNFEGVEYASNTFANCSALEEIRITGNINVAVSFAYSSLLSDGSVQSIIDALADRTETTALTLTLHADVGAKLTDEQKATVTAKNWTLVY